MGPTGVVEADPLSDDARGVLLGLEAMTVYALLLQGPDDALDQSVLLRAMRRDELLPEAITALHRAERPGEGASSRPRKGDVRDHCFVSELKLPSIKTIESLLSIIVGGALGQAFLGVLLSCFRSGRCSGASWLCRSPIRPSSARSSAWRGSPPCSPSSTGSPTDPMPPTPYRGTSAGCRCDRRRHLRALGDRLRGT